MFECFKSKAAKMKRARRLTLESQRYHKIAGLLGPVKDDNDEAQFSQALELLTLAKSRDSASCGCEVCALLRKHQRDAAK